MNTVVLIGNLTRDPELRYSTGANQNAFCRFTVAVNDRARNQQTGEWEDRPSFIPVVVFGRQAENCDRYLNKGSKVAVSGRIQTGSYTNREGNKVYTTDVVANNVEFLTPKGGGQGYSQQGGFDQGYGGQNYGGGQGQSYGQNYGGGQNQGYGQQGGYGQSQQDDGFGQGPAGGFPQDEPFQGGGQQEASQDIPEGFQALQDDDIPF